MAPHALAAPDIPDIDSLIDDSGPLPRETGDLTAISQSPVHHPEWPRLQEISAPQSQVF
jgi:hypothetical protein